MTAILALDLGTNTGVARGVPGVPPSDVTFETWEMPRGGGRDVGPFAAVFMSKFKAALDGVSIVIFEQPFMATYKRENGRGGGMSPDTVRRFYGMSFLIEGVCHLRGIQCAEVNIKKLKASFGGIGSASKEDMILSANRRGFRVGNEHEADAVACWWHVIAEVYPQHLPKYDPIFSGLMGKGAA